MSSASPSRLTIQSEAANEMENALASVAEAIPQRSAVTGAVRAEGLVKHYTSRSGTIEAVRLVDLHVDAVEVFGFLVFFFNDTATTEKMLTTLLTITAG